MEKLGIEEGPGRVIGNEKFAGNVVGATVEPENKNNKYIRVPLPQIQGIRKCTLRYQCLRYV